MKRSGKRTTVLHKLETEKSNSLLRSTKTTTRPSHPLLSGAILLLLLQLCTPTTALVARVVTLEANLGHIFSYTLPTSLPSVEVGILPSWMDYIRATRTLVGIPLSSTSQSTVTVTCSEQELVLDVTVKPSMLRSAEGVRCRQNSPQTVAMVSIDVDPTLLSPLKRVHLLELVSAYLGIHSAALTLETGRYALSHGATVLVSGKGDQIYPTNPTTTLISWVIGCGDVQAQFMAILQTLERGAENGQLRSYTNGYGVLSWQVVTNVLEQETQQLKLHRQRTKRNLKNSKPKSNVEEIEDGGSGDGFTASIASTPTAPGTKPMISTMKVTTTESTTIAETTPPQPLTTVKPLEPTPVPEIEIEITTPPPETTTAGVAITTDSEPLPTPEMTPSLTTTEAPTTTVTTEPPTTIVTTEPPTTIVTTESPTTTVTTEATTVTTTITTLESTTVTPSPEPSTSTTTEIPVINQKPTVKDGGMDKMVFKRGKMNKETLDKDLFTDPEDGDLDNMDLSIQCSENGPESAYDTEDWLQVINDNGNIVLFGLPPTSLPNDWESSSICHLEAIDKNGNKATTPLEMKVVGDKIVSYNVEFKLTLTGDNKKSFMSKPDKLMNLYKDLSNKLKIDQDQLHVIGIEDGSVVVRFSLDKFGNKDVSNDDVRTITSCPAGMDGKVKKLWSKVSSKNMTTLDPEFEKSIGKYGAVAKLEIDSKKCPDDFAAYQILTPHSGRPASPAKSSGGRKDDFWVTTVAPAIILVAFICLAAVIAIILWRKRRQQRDKLVIRQNNGLDGGEDAAITYLGNKKGGKTKPIIMEHEFEDMSGRKSKSPVNSGDATRLVIETDDEDMHSGGKDSVSPPPGYHRPGEGSPVSSSTPPSETKEGTSSGGSLPSPASSDGDTKTPAENDPLLSNNDDGMVGAVIAAGHKSKGNQIPPPYSKA